MREPRLGGYSPCWGSHKDNIRQYKTCIFITRVLFCHAHCCSAAHGSRLAYGPVTDNTWGELTTTWSYLAAAKIWTWRVVQQGNLRLSIKAISNLQKHDIMCNGSKNANETQHTTFCFHERRCIACEVQPAADTNAKHSAVFHDSLIVSVAELMIMIIDNLTTEIIMITYHYDYLSLW